MFTNDPLYFARHFTYFFFDSFLLLQDVEVEKGKENFVYFQFLLSVF